MSDRIVVMNRGRIEQDGTPEQLYFHPASRFVAEFIGETNLLPGRGTGGAEAGLDWQGHRLRGSGPAGAEGAARTASLRPERIRVSRERPSTDNVVEGRIANRLFKGSRILLDVAVGDAVLQAYADTGPGSDLAEGPVWLGWDADSLTLLAD